MLAFTIDYVGKGERKMLTSFTTFWRAWNNIQSRDIM